MNPRIHIVLERRDGQRSDVEVTGDPVTSEMVDAAEDLLATLATGNRPPPRGLYDLCATAFDTSRDAAKKRIVAAAYGMSAAKIRSRSSRSDQILADLAAARRERNEARADVAAWTTERGRLGELRQASEAPSWDRYSRAQADYDAELSRLEAWLDDEEIVQ